MNEEDPDHDQSGNWTGEEGATADDDTEVQSRSWTPRRPRGKAKPGAARRGVPRARPTAAEAIAAVPSASTVAQAHQFVQVCDNDGVASAYKVIAVLLCLLLLAVICICKMYSCRKVPTTVKTESSSACAGLGETIPVSAEKTDIRKEPSSCICSLEVYVSTPLVESHYSVKGEVQT